MSRPRKNRDYLTRIGDIGINEEFYLARVDEQPNGCHDWIGAKHVQGYGMCGYYHFGEEKCKMTVAHRIAMMLHLQRQLVHDDFVIHTCNNALCCNPQHMILGDYFKQREIMMKNGNDAKRTGPRPRVPRKQNRVYKFTDDEMRYFRDHTTTEIAARYGITKTEAGKRKHRVRYKWIDQLL